MHYIANAKSSEFNSFEWETTDQNLHNHLPLVIQIFPFQWTVNCERIESVSSDWNESRDLLKRANTCAFFLKDSVPVYCNCMEKNNHHYFKSPLHHRRKKVRKNMNDMSVSKQWLNSCLGNYHFNIQICSSGHTYRFSVDRADIHIACMQRI